MTIRNAPGAGGGPSPAHLTEVAIVSIGRTRLAGKIEVPLPPGKRNRREAFRVVRRGQALVICGNRDGDGCDLGVKARHVTGLFQESSAEATAALGWPAAWCRRRQAWSPGRPRPGPG